LIAKYGADGVRVGMLLCSPAGNDLPFDESLCEQGRNFANKIWNAFRLIQGWKENASNGNVDTRDYSEAVKWFQSKMSSELANINDLFEKYRISEALMSIYKLVWDDFCSWYLELVKPGMGQSMQPDLIHQTINFFEDLLRILHPFMPFITEELWHTLQSRSEKDYLIVASMPKPLAVDTEILKQFEAAADLISQIRNLRKSKNISMKESIEVTFLKGRDTGHEKYHSLIMKLCNLSSIAETTSKPTGVASLMVKEHEYFIHTGSFINKDAERVRINQELDYTKSFLESVEKKLTNERFISNAKAEVIALEKKKQSDAEARIRLLTEQLEALKN
jgi:valyl-tRNA synthetase